MKHEMKTIERDKVLDPVCGMTVDPATAAAKTDLNGRTYYFCSNGCRARFEARPDDYLSAGDDSHREHQMIHAGPVSGAPTEIEYTCPMHPEIVQIGPGTCPICGMALEPRVISLEAAEDNSELTDMTHRFLISAALTIPIVVLDMGSMVIDVERFLSPNLNGWFQFALATVVVIWGGYPFFQRA